MSTHSSKRLNSAYFTGLHEARELLKKADEVWGLDGKRLLEPSVGSGTFVEAARVDGYDVEWVTNELFPETSCYEADFNEDFLELSAQRVGQVDLVVGNPPFSGQVHYRNLKTSLGWAFVLKSLYEHTTRAAFVLPPNVLRRHWLDKLPDDTRVVAWSEPGEQPYVLAGAGEGTEQSVRTSCALFERGKLSEKANSWYGEEEVSGFRFVEAESEATHAVSNWGGVALRALDGTVGRSEPYASELLVEITKPEVEALLATPAVTAHVTRFGSGAAHVSQKEFHHLLKYLLNEATK